MHSVYCLQQGVFAPQIIYISFKCQEQKHSNELLSVALYKIQWQTFKKKKMHKNN